MNLLNRLDLFTTEEGPESEDNTYLGYSLALGHFTGDTYPDIAVGMPRGSNLTGKVSFKPPPDHQKLFEADRLDFFSLSFMLIHTNLKLNIRTTIAKPDLAEIVFMNKIK